MVTPELLKYVREQLAAGFFHADIVAALKKCGWADPDIDAAMGILRPLSPPRPEPESGRPGEKEAGAVRTREEKDKEPAAGIRSLGASASTATVFPVLRKGPEEKTAFPPKREPPPVEKKTIPAEEREASPKARAETPPAAPAFSGKAESADSKKDVKKEENPLRPAPVRSEPVSFSSSSKAAAVKPSSFPGSLPGGRRGISFSRPPSHRTSNLLLGVEIFFLALAGSAALSYFFLGYRKPIDLFMERYLPSGSPATSVSVPPEPAKTASVPAAFDDSDMIVPLGAFVPASDNGAVLFAGAAFAMSKSDSQFLSAYYGDPDKVASSTPPLAEAHRVISRNKKLLVLFENADKKKYYQCSTLLDKPSGCSVLLLREAGELAALESFVLRESGQSGSQKYADFLVDLGQKIGANASDMTDILVSWQLEKLGYQEAIVLRNRSLSGASLSPADRASRIGRLRSDYSAVFKILYTSGADLIDFIASSGSSTPAYPLSPGVLSIAEQAKRAATPKTFSRIETKKYFYDFYKTQSENALLDCGAPLKPEPIDPNVFGNELASSTPAELSRIGNVVGKTLFSSFAVSFESMNGVRCKLETLIGQL